MSVHVSSLVWKLDMPSTAKLILLKLADHARDDGSGVYPSQKSVAQECGLSDRSVRNVITDAIEWGILVEVPTPGNRANEYRFVMEQVELRSRWKDVPGGTSRQSRWNHVPASRNDVPAINKKHPLTVRKQREVKKEDSLGGRMAKPTVQECRDYAAGIGIPPDEGDAFHDFHTSKGWKIGKEPMKDWQGAMRTWKRRYNERHGSAAPKGKVTRTLDEALGGRDYV